MSATAANEVAPPKQAALTALTESDFFLRPGPAAAEDPTALGTIVRKLGQVWRRGLRLVAHAAERFLPPTFLEDHELTRRARLVARFGFLGAVFGSVFALFYFLIGHYWGGSIVILCSAAFAVIPGLLLRTGSLSIAGNALCLILVLGFTALCCVEGGSEGHAIAWLVSVPLCALLLVGARSATWWVVASFVAGTGVVAANLAGFKMQPGYDPAWHPYVNAAGYLSLIVFMFLLGVIFEIGRERAFARMRVALTKLEVSNNELAHLNQEKNDFLGIAAHDLKNPLTVIIGSAELVKMNLPPDQTAKLSANIVGAGQRMAQLITVLLDANAIEQGKFTSNLERCDLRALAVECVANNQPHATRKQIVITTEEGEPAWARTDRAATMQILDNLISNALKFSPPKTTVTVRTHCENGCVFAAVKDHGPGLSEADHTRLFGKYVRLSAQPTGGETSTGLGLSIVKKLAEALHGTVYCQSVLGEGARFILRLPAWDEPAKPNGKRHPRPAASTPLALDSQADSVRMAQKRPATALNDSKPA